MSLSSGPLDPCEQRPVRAWVDPDALRHNARIALAAAEGRAVIGVVKADGYGHGAAVVARALLAEGVSRLAVVSVAEGAGLRRDGIVAPILLLGGLEHAAGAARASKWGLTPVLQDMRGLELAAAVGRSDAKLAVEVEVDTGMRRMGAEPGLAQALIVAVRAAPELSLAGVFTHLACADEPDPAASRAQCAALRDVLDRVGGAGESGPDVHVANSAGLLRRDEIEAAGPLTAAVRPGLMLYGVSPFSDRSARSLGLEPAMTLAARVVATRRVEAGQAVGYGADWKATLATTIATLPLGYADGIPRAVQGCGQVHLAGAMRPVVGRVSMDSICVDVGDAPVEVGDLATVFGRTPEGERIPVEDFARSAGTIGYEVLVGVGARVPRALSTGGPPGVEAWGLGEDD